MFSKTMFQVFLVLFGLTVLAGGASAFASGDQLDPRYFQITSMRIEETPSESDGLGDFSSPFSMNAFSGAPSSSFSVEGLGTAIQWDTVINTAKQLWTIIEANRPVVNISTDHANAIPTGISTQALSSWQAPMSKTYTVVYENGFGAKVVEFSFRVIFLYGGSYKGKGRYIMNATIVPANVSVAWGFTFNANANVVSTSNAGSVRNPLAAMQLQLHWSVVTPIKHMESTDDFYIRGDGLLNSYSELH
ncbi:MAG: hypothetical protein A2428_11695 [Bdellovibrionales bacterium RIFOXYC1_FULL_54_43]|nr:MAG: hypothetical protein A2428_11695 [Bdellovibrionales bacterium RIFOXYC1_FULL_54_43]